MLRLLVLLPELIAILLVATEVIVPAVKGRPLFPMVRKLAGTKVGKRDLLIGAETRLSAAKERLTAANTDLVAAKLEIAAEEKEDETNKLRTRNDSDVPTN